MLIRVIDFETTGMPDDPTGSNICEIGWCDVRIYLSEDGKSLLDARIETPQSVFCNPGKPMPAIARAVHHISDEMVKDAPPPTDLLGKLVDGAPSYFCAHHSKFEQFFYPGDGIPWLCTYRVALRLWPDAPSHGNQALRYHLGLQIADEALAMPPHRAAPDAYVTAHLLVACLKHGGASLDDMARWSTGPALLPRVTFGKHAGKKWEHVPGDYLEWIVNKSDMDDDVKANARHHLKLRARS